MVARIVQVGAMKTLSLATVIVSLWLVRAILSTVVTTAVALDWNGLQRSEGALV